MDYYKKLIEPNMYEMDNETYRCAHDSAASINSRRTSIRLKVDQLIEFYSENLDIEVRMQELQSIANEIKNAAWDAARIKGCIPE